MTQIEVSVFNFVHICCRNKQTNYILVPEMLIERHKFQQQYRSKTYPCRLVIKSNGFHCNLVTGNVYLSRSIKRNRCYIYLKMINYIVLMNWKKFIILNSWRRYYNPKFRCQFLEAKYQWNYFYTFSSL